MSYPPTSSYSRLAAELQRHLAYVKLVRGAELYPGAYGTEGWRYEDYSRSVELREEAEQHLRSAEIFEAADEVARRPAVVGWGRSGGYRLARR